LIEGTDPYTIANDLALSEWSYSDDAVIAVIDETFEKPNIVTEGEVSGSIPAYQIDHRQYDMARPTVGIGGNYQPFEITDEKYKYLVVEATWANAGYEVDLQLYDDQLGLVSANMEPSYIKGSHEIGGSFIHNYGTWEIGLTAFPKKSFDDGKMKSMFQISSLGNTGLFSKLRGKTVSVDVMLYPGIVVSLEEPTPFGCRDATFTLTWNNPNLRLGFTILDPSGAEIGSSLSQSDIISGEVEVGVDEATVDVSMLGECAEGENYSICIFSLDDIPTSTEFTVEYSWHQVYSKSEGNAFVSATNGAVLASALNAPLLYTSFSTLAENTKDTLYKLGVEDIYLVNIGEHASEEVCQDLEAIAPLAAEYQEPEEIYDAIREITGGDDIIFTTIEPWMYWYVADLTPVEDEEEKESLYLGPATYIAAQHGSPVLIVDQHPRLSQAVVYHKDFWIKHAQYRHEPSIGDMVLTGRRVYDFLGEYGFDKEGNDREESMETIITVAGQFNIGPSWDRTFVGKALPGRFSFSPVDTAYWIARNVFYPQLVFESPATDPNGIELINGSESKIQRIGGRLKEPKGINLVITKPSREESFMYPILQTYNSIAYKFNEQASKNWGTMYTRADGITPYITPSPDPIDDGATDKVGAYYPDLDDSNVVPFYVTRAGYDNVFSTNFPAIMQNLNSGVLMWVQDTHGWHVGSGQVGFWNPDNPYVSEENPWRAYERILLDPGNLREFLRWFIYSMSGEQTSKLTDGFIKFHFLGERGSTEDPDVATLNPNLAKVSTFLQNLVGMDLLGAFGIRFHKDRLLSRTPDNPLFTTYDGMVTISPASGSGTTQKMYNGYEIDDALDNLHSCGINTVACLPAGTYLQMTYVRHGSVYQIIDPWSTSDYCAVWLQSIIKNLALGDTIGQAYEKGIRSCGPELLIDHWWWDVWENVCFYGDPDLQIFVPSVQYSDDNNWQKEDTTSLRYDAELAVDGHMPFGATSYPHAKEPVSLWQHYSLWILVAIAIIIMVLIVVYVTKRKK
jgi:hypothetical protein